MTNAVCLNAIMTEVTVCVEKDVWINGEVTESATTNVITLTAYSIIMTAETVQVDAFGLWSETAFVTKSV